VEIYCNSNTLGNKAPVIFYKNKLSFEIWGFSRRWNCGLWSFGWLQGVTTQKITIHKESFDFKSQVISLCLVFCPMRVAF
jgi:hypothetical protein